MKITKMGKMTPILVFLLLAFGAGFGRLGGYLSDCSPQILGYL